MDSSGKSFVLMLIVLLLPLQLLFLPIAHGEFTGSYSNNTDNNPVAFTITIYSPDNQTTYKNTLPLNFTVNWTRYPSFDFPIPPAPKITVSYSYSIDSNSAVFVVSNQS